MDGSRESRQVEPDAVASSSQVLFPACSDILVHEFIAGLGASFGLLHTSHLTVSAVHSWLCIVALNKLVSCWKLRTRTVRTCRSCAENKSSPVAKLCGDRAEPGSRRSPSDLQIQSDFDTGRARVYWIVAHLPCWKPWAAPKKVSAYGGTLS